MPEVLGRTLDFIFLLRPRRAPSAGKYCADVWSVPKAMLIALILIEIFGLILTALFAFGIV
jgi:hypothetical protein